jgi:prevent-host-death family protein
MVGVTIKRTFTATQARNNFSEVFEAALHDGPVVVRKRSKSVAVIPLDLFEILADLEGRLDRERADAALREYFEAGGTPLAKLKKELGFAEE